MIRLIRAMVSLVLVGSLISACAFYGSGTEGRVVDAATGKPLAGAIVVARWFANATAIVDSQTVCLYVKTTTTDDRGRYRIPSWFKRPTLWPTTGMRRVLTVYRPGYEFVRQHGDTLDLKLFTGTRRERLAYLEHTEYSARCPGARESEKNMLPFYRALHEEAIGLAATRGDQKVVNGFLSNIEMIELGYEAAMKKALQRAEKRKSQP